MLPRKLVTMQTADKILFIGKYVRVMNKKRNGEGNILSNKIYQMVKELSIYNFLKFQDLIEGIRAVLAEEFLRLFLKEENIFENLVKLKDFCLLGRGEFYQIFIEECQTLFRLPPGKYAENDINNRVLQTVTED